MPEYEVNGAVSPRLLTITGAAEFLGISKWSVRALLWDGLIPFVAVGRSHMVDRRDLVRWLDTHKQIAGKGTITGTSCKVRPSLLESTN